jgi:hypothetical protein
MAPLFSGFSSLQPSTLHSEIGYLWMHVLGIVNKGALAGLPPGAGYTVAACRPLHGDNNP